MEERISNYEKWVEEWRVRFLTMDQEALKEKLPEIQEEGEYLTIYHFARKYGIHKTEGTIKALESDIRIGHMTKLNIYTLLWYASPLARIRNEWVPFEKLKDARPFAPAFFKGNTQAFAAAFSGHLEELKRACEKLGGIPLKHSDAGYQINAFDCMPMQFYFWDRDDEFEAQGNILFDKSATDFVHVESTVSIATEGIQRLMEEAGISSGNVGFQMK